jgi:hypothetical protein
MMVDIRFTDTDANAYKCQNPHDALRRQETEKRKKYLRLCLEQRRSFVPWWFPHMVSSDLRLMFCSNRLHFDLQQNGNSMFCCKGICKCTHQSSDTASNQCLHLRFPSPSIQNEPARSPMARWCRPMTLRNHGHFTKTCSYKLQSRGPNQHRSKHYPTQ